jgi:hypothetical protein
LKKEKGFFFFFLFGKRSWKKGYIFFSGNSNLSFVVVFFFLIYTFSKKTKRLSFNFFNAFTLEDQKIAVIYNKSSYIAHKMVSKATPIEELPNVQMSMEREEYPRAQIQHFENTPPQAHHGNQSFPQSNETAMPHQNQQMPPYPPPHDYRNPNQNPNMYPPHQQGQPGQQALPQQPYQQNSVIGERYVEENIVSNPDLEGVPSKSRWGKGFLGEIMNQKKYLGVLIVLLFVLQLSGTQRIFRKLASLAKISDRFIVIGSKLFSAIVFAFVILFLKSNYVMI